MKLLVFAGAGTSVELGVPAMAGLATEFLQHARQWNVEPDLVARVMGSELDVEVLIERLDKVCSAKEPLGAVVDIGAEIARVDVIRAEVEWFVQHVCERIVPRDARLMWGSLLNCASVHEIALVTTNYDRAIELAANAEGHSLDDGFGPFHVSERASWNGFNAGGVDRLIKLHGSTDWFADQTSGQPSKLRHPMPLFGRGTLRLPQGDELGSALVLPSREKLLTRPPYPRLTQAFLNACDRCEMAVFVGASLRDFHVRDAALTIARDRPVFVVNRQGKTFDIQGVVAIAQPASDFLISTLPAALSAADPASVLKNVSNNQIRTSTGIFESLQIALDDHQSTTRRCEAIEALDQRGVSLSAPIIEQLLVGEDCTVARYALALVTTSHESTHLSGAAHQCRHVNDALFAEELGLLEKIVSTGVPSPSEHTQQPAQPGAAAATG